MHKEISRRRLALFDASMRQGKPAQSAFGIVHEAMPETLDALRRLERLTLDKTASGWAGATGQGSMRPGRGDSQSVRAALTGRLSNADQTDAALPESLRL